MSAIDHLAVANDCMERMERAGISFALVCAFPEGGGAFLARNERDEAGELLRDENNETMPQLMRYYAGLLAKG